LIVGPAGLAIIKEYEKCSLTAYKKTINGKPDVWTIGYGHTTGVVEGAVCTQAQADAWLFDDATWAAKVLAAYVKISLNQNQFDALCSLVFNIGSGNFESSTLLKLLNAGDTAAAAQQILVWDHENHQVSTGLDRRRHDEYQLFVKGT
jgi:lysozyme